MALIEYCRGCEWARYVSNYTRLENSFFIPPLDYRFPLSNLSSVPSTRASVSTPAVAQSSLNNASKSQTKKYANPRPRVSTCHRRRDTWSKRDTQYTQTTKLQDWSPEPSNWNFVSPRYITPSKSKVGPKFNWLMIYILAAQWTHSVYKFFKPCPSPVTAKPHRALGGVLLAVIYVLATTINHGPSSRRRRRRW